MENLKKLYESINSISFSKRLLSNLDLQSELIAGTTFLDNFYSPTLNQRIFHFVHNKPDIMKCKHCGGPAAWNKFDAINYSSLYYPSKNYQEYCDKEECRHVKNSLKIKKQWDKKGITNISQLPKWKETKVKNCLEKHGTEWFSQTKEFKDKVKETSLEKYGVDHFTQHENVQKKKVETCLKKYGKEHVSQVAEIKKRAEDTCIERYGAKIPMQNADIREKIKHTNRDRYGADWVVQSEYFKNKSSETYNKIGVNHCSQVAGVIEKRTRAGYQWKEYIFPSGKIIKIQGYENFAIDHLLKIYDENDIITDNKEIENYIGKVFYEHNGRHRYFPDLYILSNDTVIEVKSKWTYDTQKKINMIKAKTVIKNGHNFQFLLMNNEQVFSQFTPDI